MSTRHDVAVIGAGPAGCAAAIAMKRAGIDAVLLIEAGNVRGHPFGESLPPDVRLVLAELGLRDAFDALRFDPCYGSASSWGEDALGCNDFLFNPHGPGWHIDRDRFDAFLREQAVRCGVTLRMDSVCESAAATESGMRLRIRSACGARESVDAAFVIDASGQGARVGRAMGAERLAGDRLVCIAARMPIGGDNTLGGRSLLEAVEYGWWYAARIGPDDAVVIAATDPLALPDYRLHEAMLWHRQLTRTRHVGAALGRDVAVPGELTVRQARSARMSHCAGPRWLAIGDAASAYDPISSQGVLKAMVEGIAAARRIPRLLAGPGTDVQAEHEHWMHRRFTDYLQIRQHFYSQETRWPRAAFWQRRRQAHAAPTAPAAPHPLPSQRIHA